MQEWVLVLVASGLSFVISAVTGIFLIPFLKKKCFGQTILEIGPRWHKSKQGTPIMGGFMFIAGSIISVAISYAIRHSAMPMTDIVHAADSDVNYGFVLLVFAVFALLFSAIGFADDYIKAVKKQNLGLNAKQKLLFQFLLAAGFLWVLHVLGMTETTVNLVFAEFDLKLWYYPIMVLFIVFMSNAVNITDGIDGLCGTVTAIALIVTTVLCSYLKLGELSLYSAAIAGGVLGFLVWNLHPAKCFMGDTGSMYLGAVVAGFAIITRQHLVMVLVGIVYVCEALSVVLQVISFKTTKKRLFKMSPIHHHFELSGFGEYRIVRTFSAVGLIFGIIAIVLLTALNRQ
ncbi:MAG: phospho-N-acetylmuramoyl-pentapeptide-transferase [Oscillospiraceae bacterium]|jgi:phospho-N-acetylmuramoyl-pentapeptide-transferase|nr:phospho-N-acetylmuramoyl-pentapeptide-transferase [Oscillospiraceae bacterium]